MADQQDALGDAGAQADELLRLLEEFDHLLELLLSFLNAGHIFEGNRRLIAAEHASPTLAEGHRLVVRALRLPQHEPNQADDQQGRQDVGDQADDRVPVAGLLDVDFDVFWRKVSLADPQGLQLFDGGLTGFGARQGRSAILVDDLELIFINDDTGDFAGSDSSGNFVKE